MWQELQVMYGWFQLCLSNFDTGINNVLIPHLTEPAPCMGQVLSPIGAHSVSGLVGHFLISLDVTQRVPGGIERTFHSSSSTVCKTTVTYGPSTRFSQLSMHQGIFYGTFTAVAIWVNPDRQSAP